MIALTLGLLVACTSVLAAPSPYPGPQPGPYPGPMPAPAPYQASISGPSAIAQPRQAQAGPSASAGADPLIGLGYGGLGYNGYGYGGLGYGGLGYGGYGYGGYGFPGYYGGCGGYPTVIEEVGYAAYEPFGYGPGLGFL